MPAPEWFQRFREIECSGPVSILIAPEADTKMSNYWMVPYPYQVPVYIRYFQSKFPDKLVIGPDEISTLTHDDYQRLVNLIQQRLDTFIESMISEENLAMVDSIEDYGVVINGTTGRIHPFVYSDIDHMELVNMPVACEYNIAAAALSTDSLNMESEDFRNKYFRIMYDDRFQFNTWIMPVFNEETGDKFNRAKNHMVAWSMTESAHMVPEDYVAIMRYVNEAMRLRFKVVTVP